MLTKNIVHCLKRFFKFYIIFELEPKIEKVEFSQKASDNLTFLNAIRKGKVHCRLFLSEIKNLKTLKFVFFFFFFVIFHLNAHMDQKYLVGIDFSGFLLLFSDGIW